MNTATLSRTTVGHFWTDSLGHCAQHTHFSQRELAVYFGDYAPVALYLFGEIGSLMVDPKAADMGANPLNLSPALTHPLGTEGFGRDMFTVMVIGIPNTFKIGFLAGSVGVIIGAFMGLLCRATTRARWIPFSAALPMSCW